jgi:hypothetical protein
MEDLAMLWFYLVAAGAGALLGLIRLRILAVLAGSVGLVAVSIVLAALGHWSLLEAVINMFLLLATLQFSYLAALLVSSTMRVASRDRFDTSTRRRT